MGQAVTFGGLDLNNMTASAITIEDIRLHPEPTGDFEIIDIVLAGPDRKIGGGTMIGFPATDFVPYLEPVEGAVIQPDDGGRLVVVGARLNRLGHASFSRIDVDYRVGGKRYTGRYKDAFVLCTPPGGRPRCNSGMIDE